MRCRYWRTPKSAANGRIRSATRLPIGNLPRRFGRTRLDSVFLNRLWGPIIFSVVVIAVFQTHLFSRSAALERLTGVLDVTGRQVGALLPEGLLRSLIVDGIWKGTGSVLVFLPQILLLFLVIGILEDSGYLARAAVIADKTMSRVGLNGKAFIPLLSAYACAVPAIMATRTIENKRDRIATILIAPFMTCSARLPVYTMIIAAFIPNRPLLGPFFGTRALAMLGLYVLGFLMAVITARMLKSSVLKSKDSPFILEMPPYRWPTLRSLRTAPVGSWQGVPVSRRHGDPAVSPSFFGLLTTFPMHNGQPPAIQDSVVATMGHVIEPVIRPLGFDWKIGVGLLTSIRRARSHHRDPGHVARSRSSIARLRSCRQRLRHELTPAAAVALLVFFAFAMQCMSTLAVVRRETNGWKWPAVQFAYMTLVAYASAFAAYHIALLF